MLWSQNENLHLLLVRISIQFLNKKYQEILSFYNPFKIYKKKHLSFKKIFSYAKSSFSEKNLEYYLKNDSELFSERNKLLNYTKNYLTTECLAKNVLSIINGKN